MATQRRKPKPKEQADAEALDWLLRQAAVPLPEMDEVCRIVMCGFARPKVRFDTADASIFVNTFLRNEGQGTLSLWGHHVDRALLLMWNRGWIRSAHRWRELLDHYRFTPEGIARWETVEREKFFIKLEENREVWRERREHEEREQQRADNIKRFGVEWDVHAYCIEEWDD